MRFFERNRWWMVLADAALVNAALALAFFVRFEWTLPAYYQARYPAIAGFITALRLSLLLSFGVYRGMWRYIGVKDLVDILKGITLGTLLIACSSFLVRSLSQRGGTSVLEWLSSIPISVMVAEWLGAIILIGGLRLWLRLFKQYRTAAAYRNVERKRTLIVGAGDAAEMVLRQILSHPEYGYQPVGLVDDDRRKQGHRIHGVPVLGTRAELNEVAERQRAEEIIIAIPSAPGGVVKEVVEHCRQSRIKFKIVPGIKEIIEGDVSISQIREVELEDLLGRPTVDISLDEMAGYLTGRRVLVTGAGGSIGSELCRQIAPFTPSQLLLLGKGENSIYEIGLELASRHKTLSCETLIGDVSDAARIGQVFADYQPQVVFHAAAHKHVPLMERNPGEAVKNNVFGTRTVAEAALASGVERFVLISTDKAVNPSSVMGATKRVAEEVARRCNAAGRTKFITVRFGNVLGSRGSVVPLFKRQIAAGGPVTVTHPEVERYFMTIPEAVKLVIQAGAMGQGGEVFVLDMGQPVKIVDMARDLIKLSGLEPDRDIRIEFTGLRPGEKLYEELLTAAEGVNATRHAQIFVSRSVPFAADGGERMAALEQAAASGRPERIVSALRAWLPDFRPGEV